MKQRDCKNLYPRREQQTTYSLCALLENACDASKLSNQPSGGGTSRFLQGKKDISGEGIPAFSPCQIQYFERQQEKDADKTYFFGRDE